MNPALPIYPRSAVGLGQNIIKAESSYGDSNKFWRRAFRNVRALREVSSPSSRKQNSLALIEGRQESRYG